MAKSARHRSKALAAVAALMFLAGCTVHQSGAPSLSGPSELALSVSVAATPDSVTQDGSSQSSIVVTAKDANGKPLAAVPFRLDMAVNGTTQDFGTLQSRSVVTGSDGRATTLYTAPPPPPASAGGSGARLSILATAVGGNYQTALAQSADIHLVPPGVVLPPAGSPFASFTFPTPALMNVAVLFDASPSSPGSNANLIAAYTWSFGDGGTGSGRSTPHIYAAPGAYTTTLTVTNDRGLSSSSSQVVNVASPTAPTAQFVVSPTSNPSIGQTVFFNADQSRATPGRTIVQYSWSWGDGTPGASGFQAQHAWASAGTFTVVLSVLDDANQKGTATATVTVTNVPTGGAPGANFTFSPTAPVAPNAHVFFNASSSTAGVGRTIVSYKWDFGDGHAATTGATTDHTYVSAGSYAVTLLITDDLGQTSTKSAVVNVSPAGTVPPPTAAFTFSPTQPAVNESVFFSGANSKAAPGHTITTYTWDFGDGTTCAGGALSVATGAGCGTGSTGLTPSHKYINPAPGGAGTYIVTLTVTDDLSQNGSITQGVPVGNPPKPTAAFVFSPASPAVSATVFFDASTSTTAQGQTITNYSWAFGDGTTCVGTVSTVTSGVGTCGLGSGVTGQRPEHSYSTAGVYSVTLTVTDSAGRTDVTSRTVPVGAVPPQASFAITTAGPYAAPALISFDALASVAFGAATITQYHWTWGDGQPDVIVGAPTTTASHTFNVPGTFTVTLTVTDSNGKTAAISQTVTVS
jgi:PKD repeat protein